jgi:hypothetical protein
MLVDIGTEKEPLFVNADRIILFEKIKNADPNADEPQTMVLVAGERSDWKLETRVSFQEVHDRLKKFIHRP